MRDELYIPVSEIARVQHGGVWHTNVEVDWLRLGRAAPIAPYPELISDYARLSAAERSAAEQYIDELFTGEEYDLLRGYLGAARPGCRPERRTDPNRGQAGRSWVYRNADANHDRDRPVGEVWLV